MKYISTFQAARRSGAPILVMRTHDHNSTITALALAVADKAPLICWDISRGVVPVNKAGEAAAAALNGEQPPAIATGNPVEALQLALEKMPERTVLFMQNAHLLIDTQDMSRAPVIQCIYNLRDAFKSSQRTLVLLVPDMKVPPELASDVVAIDVALPAREELKSVTAGVYEAARVTPGEEVEKVVDAVAGLSGFAAEQALAMSITKNGMNLPELWERKRTLIEQVGGLKVARRKASFDQLGGLDNIKAFARQIIAGKRPPKLTVLIDEVEKQMAGLGDSNGINQDAFGQLLSAMQDNNWSGMLLPGFPGTGKTEFGNAMGSEADGLFITMDLGGMKGSLVGSSERMIRAAVSSLLAMGGEDVFFLATCNSMGSLRPELKRRFSKGTFFFDFPTAEERAPIWKLYREKYQLPADMKLPKCEMWTGAEIRNVCAMADELRIDLTEAAKYISPVARTMGEEVEKLRASANNRYLSATTPGLYQSPNKTSGDGKRKIEVGNN